jgi:hypothetical protein
MCSFVTSVLPHKNIETDQVKEADMSRRRSTHGEERNAYRILVRKSEGKRTLEKLGSGDNVTAMGLTESEWDSTNLIHLAQDRDQAPVNTIMNLWVP